MALIPDRKGLASKAKKGQLVAKLFTVNRRIREITPAVLAQESIELPECEGAVGVTVVYGAVHVFPSEVNVVHYITGAVYAGKVTLSGVYLHHASAQAPIALGAYLAFGNVAGTEISSIAGWSTGPRYWPVILDASAADGKYYVTAGVVSQTGVGLTHVGEAHVLIRYLVHRTRTDSKVGKNRIAFAKRELA
jgi:hypothetical protein